MYTAFDHTVVCAKTRPTVFGGYVYHVNEGWKSCDKNSVRYEFGMDMGAKETKDGLIE